MSAYAQGVRYIEAACDLARRHGAAVEVDMKEKGAGRQARPAAQLDHEFCLARAKGQRYWLTRKWT